MLIVVRTVVDDIFCRDPVDSVFRIIVQDLLESTCNRLPQTERCLLFSNKLPTYFVPLHTGATELHLPSTHRMIDDPIKL